MFKHSVLLPAVLGCLSMGLAPASMAAPKAPAADTMDRDLVEVTVPQLERYYAEHRYTVTQVVRWHLALFGVQIESCARCGGQLKIIASIEEPQLIAKILSHLERTAPEQSQSELVVGARGPPAQSCLL